MRAAATFEAMRGVLRLGVAAALCSSVLAACELPASTPTNYVCTTRSGATLHDGSVSAVLVCRRADEK